MTAKVLLTGQLFRAPSRRNGKSFVAATAKVKKAKKSFGGGGRHSMKQPKPH
jgi:hypothetical protein